MSGAKHTPEPWQQKCADYDPLTIIGNVDGPDNGEYRYSRICDVDDGDSAIANAHLIAAAPELLRVLIAALEQSACDGDLCMHQWHEDARKAIDEAQGRS